VTCRSALQAVWRNGGQNGGGRVRIDKYADDSLFRASDIPSAVEEFRQRCNRVTFTIPSSLRDDQLQMLLDAACGLVAGILSGIHRHQGEYLNHVEAEVCTFTLGEVPPGTMQDLLSISVRFEPRVTGELATRSRIAVSVQVDGDLTFTLQVPSRLSSAQPRLTLRVEGLNLPALPETTEIRRRLTVEVGSGMNPQAAYRWWMAHKDSEYPTSRSKFRRIVESLLEQGAVRMLGEKQNSEAFWGYLHTTDLHVTSFEFILDKRVRPGGVALVARLRDPRDQQEGRDRAIVREITIKNLKDSRAAAERCASSAINIAAMLYGEAIGQPGAKVDVVTKLLSAAEWWGPGKKGWHSHDDTWECTDKKDAFQRVVKKQGRVIWHTEHHTTTAPSGNPLEVGASPVAAPGVGAVALVLLLTVIALTMYSRLSSLSQ